MKRNLIAQGHPEGHVEVIPYFTPIPEEPFPQSRTGNILFVGRISPEKGLERLLDITSLLKADFRLVIVGTGDSNYQTFLMKKVRENRLEAKIEFVGKTENSKLGPYYREAAFLVVPSVWPEPFGIVGIEAMAHSRPVIAFDVGGISDWLEDGKTGYLVPCGDSEGFARKIELLLGDPSLRTTLGDHARHSAALLFNKTDHVRKLTAVFRGVAGLEASHP
jgi:glycosyltransferase involved in cell wall biosynthesis